VHSLGSHPSTSRVTRLSAGASSPANRMNHPKCAAASSAARLSSGTPRRRAMAAFWQENDVRSYGEGTKHLRHRTAGLIAMEYSSFAVDGWPDLGMMVYNPATPGDMSKVLALMEG
jgi:hypothetical protein